MGSKDSIYWLEAVSALRDSPFVLFVGAGVNGTLSPKWKEILDTLRGIALGYVRTNTPGVSRDRFNEYCTSLNYETQAELYKILLGPAFDTHLKRCIYTDPATNAPFDRRELSAYMRSPGSQRDRRAPKYQLLRDVAALSQSPNVVAILTLNYDNYLEMSIESLVRAHPDKAPGRKPHSIPGGGTWQVSGTSPSLPIHHIHGFLPYPTPDLPQDSEDIVLSQDQYLEAFNDMTRGSSCAAIHYLTHYPALFIGLSMSDWNLLRFLRASQSTTRTFFHYCLMKQMGWPDRIHLSLLASYGIRTILCSPHAGEEQDSFAAVYRTTQRLIEALRE